MGISIGFGLGPLRFSAPLVTNSRRVRTYTTAQYMAAARRSQPRAPKPDYGHTTVRWWWALVLLAGLVLVPVAVLFQIAVFATSGFWIGLLWLLFQLAVASAPMFGYLASRRAAERIVRAKREAEAAARAEYEHAAIVRGDYHLGIHGAFPPAVVTRSTPYAVPEPVPYEPRS